MPEIYIACAKCYLLDLLAARSYDVNLDILVPVAPTVLHRNASHPTDHNSARRLPSKWLGRWCEAVGSQRWAPHKKVVRAMVFRYPGVNHSETEAWCAPIWTRSGLRDPAGHRSPHRGHRPRLATAKTVVIETTETSPGSELSGISV